MFKELIYTLNPFRYAFNYARSAAISREKRIEDRAKEIVTNLSDIQSLLKDYIDTAIKPEVWPQKSKELGQNLLAEFYSAYKSRSVISEELDCIRFKILITATRNGNDGISGIDEFGRAMATALLDDSLSFAVLNLVLTPFTSLDIALLNAAIYRCAKDRAENEIDFGGPS